MDEARFIRAITMLPVDDIDAAVAWYRKVLNFQLLFLNEGDHPGEATNYAVLERDGVPLHLILDEGLADAGAWNKAGTGYFYLHVQPIEPLYQQVEASGTSIARSLQAEPWGARAFNLTDPSGNEIHLEEPREG